MKLTNLTKQQTEIIKQALSLAHLELCLRRQNVQLRARQGADPALISEADRLASRAAQTEALRRQFAACEAGQ